MAHYIEQLQALFYGIESTEGTAVLGTATEALLVRDLKKPIPRDFHEREFVQAFGTRPGVVGAIQSAPFSFAAELKNRGVTNNVPELDELYKTVFGTRTLDTLNSTATGGTSTVITTASTAGLTVGNIIGVETTASSDVYEARRVTALTANTNITVSPALSFSPASGAALVGSLTFVIAETGHQSLSFQNYLNSTEYWQAVGCRGNFKIESEGAGKIPMGMWDMLGWSWSVNTGGTRPSSTFDTNAPPLASTCKWSVDTTLTDIVKFSFDLGNVVTPLTSQNSTLGVYKTPITNAKPRGSFTVHPESFGQITGWTAPTAFQLTGQWGNTLNNGVCINFPTCQRNPVAWGDDNGVGTNEVGFIANGGTAAVYLGFF